MSVEVIESSRKSTALLRHLLNNDQGGLQP